MASILISGPAGAGKSAIARGELEARRADGELAIAADFQSLYVALTLEQRGTDGRYPVRNPQLLPITEYTRRAVTTGAVQAGISIIATNSDGNPARRAELVRSLGPGATERIVDPGRDVVQARLADPATGQLSAECAKAIGRWYDRL